MSIDRASVRIASEQTESTAKILPSFPSRLAPGDAIVERFVQSGFIARPGPAVRHGCHSGARRCFRRIASTLAYAGPDDAGCAVATKKMRTISRDGVRPMRAAPTYRCFSSSRPATSRLLGFLSSLFWSARFSRTRLLWFALSTDHLGDHPRLLAQKALGAALLWPQPRALRLPFAFRRNHAGPVFKLGKVGGRQSCRKPVHRGGPVQPSRLA